MPISREHAVSHVASWERRLAASRAPYRSTWPRYLFRHEEISNVVRLLQAGCLLSRSAASGFRDVAAGDVLATDQRAHSYARLYFRPTTPTQFRIEGVRRPDEIWHSAHAPVLVMLVFDSISILSSEGTSFSNGNMQNAFSQWGDSLEFFSSIPFEDVYHVGAFAPSQRDSIVRARCAEVLAVSPLQLRPHLRAVVCRSSAERAYLVDLLGGAIGLSLNRLIVKQTEPAIFENKWAYVDTVDASVDGFRISFHPRNDAGPIRVAIRVSRDGSIIWSGGIADASGASVWRVPCEMRDGWYRCEVDIEGCLAYSASHLIDQLPF